MLASPAVVDGTVIVVDLDGRVLGDFSGVTLDATRFAAAASRACGTARIHVLAVIDNIAQWARHSTYYKGRRASIQSVPRGETLPEVETI